MASPKEGCTCSDPMKEVPGAKPITSTDLGILVKQYATMLINQGVSMPLFIYGAPGIGKTEIINSVGKQLQLPVFTSIASTMEPSDVRGIPFANEQTQTASWFPPREFVRDEEIDRTYGSFERSKNIKPAFPQFANNDYDRPAIYFFDELNLAAPDVRAAFYQLILSGKLGKIDISNSLRIGAGNQKFLVPEIKNSWLGTPLATRFNIYYMVPSLAAWKAGYADKMVGPKGNQKPQINPLIMKFIYDTQTAHPSFTPEQAFYCVNGSINPGECMGKLLATPRGWKKVSDMIDAGLTSLYDFQSALGTTIGTMFGMYYASVSKNIKIEEKEKLNDLLPDRGSE